MKFKELLEARERVWKRQTELNQIAAGVGDAEPRSLTEAENTEYENLEAEYTRLDETIKRTAALEDRQASAIAAAQESRGVAVGAGPQESGAGIAADDEERSLSNDPEERAEQIKERDNAELRAFLVGGVANLNQEQRTRLFRRQARYDLNKRGGDLPPDVRASIQRAAEARALTSGTDASGKYTIPEGFYARLTEAELAYGGVRAANPTILTTSTGETMPMPTVDDTSNSGQIVAENTEVDEQDITFSEKQLDAYNVVSDLVRVPFQLLEDSAFDIGGLLARLLGIRVARKSNALYTTGTGSSQPNGVVTASTLGKTAASATVIAWAEMLDLKYSVDAAYHNGAKWMFNSSSFLKKAKQLLDGNSRPLFQPDVQSGRVDRIDGDPFVINTNMADVATGAKVALYGDFSYFFIRDVRGINLVRLNERFGEFLQVGFMAYRRTDSELLDAGTNPIKHYIMA